MGLHAVRNASGSKRWMNCPGSIRDAAILAAQGIRPRSSHYARLGTAAHGLGEFSLSQRRHPSEWLGGTVYLDDREDALVVTADPTSAEAAVIKSAAEMGWEGFPIDQEMVDAVGVYYDTVMEDYAEAGPHAELHVERRFNLNWLIGFDWDEEAAEADPQYVSPSGIRRVWDDALQGLVLRHADGRPCHGPMFGTNDASLLLPYDLLRVYDYKHGQGVVVEVEDNSQELYYALGIAEEVGWCFDELELVIVQPRAPHADGAVRRWRCSAARLREFAQELKAAAEAVDQHDAPVVAGEWCTFCPVAAYCGELRDAAFRTACVEFQVIDDQQTPVGTGCIGPDTSDEFIGLSMASLPILDAFIKAVEGEAMRRLRESATGEGFGQKLVRKRSNRAFRKEVEVTREIDGQEVEVTIPYIDWLVEQGFSREDLFEEPKPKGPAKVEKLRPVGLMAELKEQKVRAPAAHIASIVAAVTYKPEGGITIAPASDPRPAVSPSVAAAADFEEVEEA